jgi:hypothetical protein
MEHVLWSMTTFYTLIGYHIKAAKVCVVHAAVLLCDCQGFAQTHCLCCTWMSMYS